MKKILVLAMLFAAISASAKVLVIASILPISYIAERVGGDKVNVVALVTGDVHSYEPKPSDMKAISKARLFLATGLEFEEAWIPRFVSASKDLLIVHTDANIQKIKGNPHNHSHDERENHQAHKKDEHDAYEHKGHVHKEYEYLDEGAHFDPHVWLDPLLAKVMAENIAQALISVDSKNQATYKKNLATLSKELDELDLYANNELKNLKKRAFIVYHPAWGYFAKRYNLEQISIEKEGKEPRMSELAKIIEDAKQEGVSVVFTSPQYSKRSAKTIADELNAKIVLIDPLNKDYLSNMRSAVKAFKDANQH